MFKAGPGRDAVCKLVKIPAAESVAKSRARAKTDGRLERQRQRDLDRKKAKRMIAAGKKASPFDALF